MPRQRSVQPVALHKRCDLLLEKPIQKERPPFLSAASGLVCCDNHFFVVADDELHLGIFSNDPTQPGDTHRLLDGKLPPEPKPRKKQKPDFEVLTYLPKTTATGTPMLLICGSGSRANRSAGLLLALNHSDEIKKHTAPLPFDLTPLYNTLENEFGIVNIEGATVCGDRLLLLQRGNKNAGTNAIVHLNLLAAIDSMLDGALDVSALQTIERIELGEHEGVALGFTDAMTLPNGELLALAVAEDTDDPYVDGETSACYVCHFDTHNQLQAMTPLIAPAKTEGIALWPQRSGVANSQRELAFVTDADDPNIPAALLTASLSAFI